MTFKRPIKHRSSTDQVSDKNDTEKTLALNFGGDSVPSTPQAHPKHAPSTIESTIETTPSAIESAIERILSSTDFANSSTERKIINLLRVDPSLTLDKLFPLLNLSRKGVQKAIELLKESGHFPERA